MLWARVHPACSGGSRILINCGEAEGRLEFLIGHECKHLSDWRPGLQAGLYADPAVRQRLEDRADAFGLGIERELRQRLKSEHSEAGPASAQSLWTRIHLTF